MYILRKLTHPLNIVKQPSYKHSSSPSFITLLGMKIETSEEQPSNAESPIFTTLLGITTEVKDEQSENA